MLSIDHGPAEALQIKSIDEAGSRLLALLSDAVRRRVRHAPPSTSVLTRNRSSGNGSNFREEGRGFAVPPANTALADEVLAPAQVGVLFSGGIDSVCGCASFHHISVCMSAP